MLRLLSSPTSQEVIVSLTLDRVLIVKRLDVLHQPLVLATLPPSRSKLLWGSRDLALKSFSRSSLTCRSKGSKEIRSSLLLGTEETHVEEVLLGIGGLSKVNLFSFVKNCDLVEKIVS
jgi:hypothetical protein